MLNQIAVAILILSTLAASQELYVSRRLQQNEVTVTAENVGRLANRVADAERGTTFVFESDVVLTETIVVTENRLSFRGADGSKPTITCAENEPGFQINGNNALFEDLIIRDCTATAVDVNEEIDPFAAQGGEIETRALDISFRNVDFINNVGSEAQSQAGGIAAGHLVSVIVENCRFESNSGVSGGAITFTGRELIVEDSIFVDNDGDSSGGAIFCHVSNFASEEDRANSSVSISGCEFTNNRVAGGGEDLTELTLSNGVPLESNPYLTFRLPSPSGGALFIGDYNAANIEGCSFTDNRALAGGAIYLSDNDVITISQCQFISNEAASEDQSLDLQLGGAIFAAFANADSAVTISESAFDGNRAAYGGAVHFVAPTDAEFEIGQQSTFTNNVAAFGGGALLFRNVDSPTVNRATFVNNSAFVGGAIFLTNGAGMRVPEQISVTQATTFADNVAYDGGAIYGMGGGVLQLMVTFFERNHAENHGGAVCYIDSKAGGSLSIQDARMFNNAAGRGGAIYAENIVEFVVVAAGVDPVAVALGQAEAVRNEFRNNRAMAGGAVYYRASNLVRNRFSISTSVFSNNEAFSDAESVHEQPLIYPGADAARDAATAVAEDDETEENSHLLNPRSSDPCHPGGGGAICLVLSGTAIRAPVSVLIQFSNFTRNFASSGGALLISTDISAEWQPSCVGGDTTEALLTSDPCSRLNLRALRFERNRAEFAGGAILAADFNHVFFTTSVDDQISESQTLDNADQAESFFNNRVGSDGYGENIAGTAVRLNIIHPAENETTGLIVEEHSSGQANVLPEIRVEVLDGLDQVVSAGIVDSVLLVRANSRQERNNTSISAGQVDATAVDGVATFNALTLSAPAGRYEVNFVVRGSAVEGANGDVTLRECRLGERNNRDGFVCEECIFEAFTFFTEVERCADCPAHAKCAGGASLVPVDNYWHSSPFSVVMHECFNSEACSYDNRDDILESQRSEHLEEFFRRFDGDNPTFSEEEYTQCEIGYDGPLCGSCQDGFGHADGKRCVRCDSKSATASVIFLLAVWQLVFLAITIRSALVSIRDMNQMMAITQQQALASGPSRRSGGLMSTMGGVSALMDDRSRASLPEDTSVISHRTAGMPAESASALAPGEIEAQYAQNLNTAAASMMQISGGLQQPTQKQQYSAEYIVAAQHVSETIKIFVNFFQVTSVAVNINLEWTSSIKNMLATMNSVAGFSNGATFTPMTCLLDSDSEDRSIYGVILRIAFPLFLMSLSMLFFFIQWFIIRRNPSVTRIMSQQFIRSRTIICFLVVGFFAYQSISEDLMGTVSCIKLDADEMDQAGRFDQGEDIDYSQFAIAQDRYWTEDTNVECFSSSHAYLVGFLGIPGIILFLGGVPLYLLVFLLYKRQRDELLELNVLNTYGFIYQNYEDKFVYWEVMILIRKALIGAIVVFAYPLGSNLQGVMALGVLILALAIHLIATPFKYLPLNILEGLSLVVTIFTFYAGVVFNDENTTESAEVLLSVLLVFINTLLVILFGCTVFVYGDKYVVAKLKYMDVTDIPKSPVTRMLLLASLLSDQFRTLVASHVQTVRANRPGKTTGGVQMSTLPVSAGASSPSGATAQTTIPNQPAQQPAVVQAANEEEDALI